MSDDRPDGAARLTGIRLLGRFTVETDAGALEDAQLGNRKARQLLKLLAVRQPRHVAMDTIVDVLWSDDPPPKAVQNVASLVSRLRSVLGADVIEGGRSGYRLVIPRGCAVDVDLAGNLVTEAEVRLASGQPSLALTASTRALEVLGAGAPLEEETAEGEWLDELRRELGQLARRARVAGWTAHTAMGEHRQVVALADEAVAADAFDEEAHRVVMAGYYRLGEHGEALAAFERVRATLVEELGVDPGPETVELYESIVRGEPIPTTGDPATAHAPRRLQLLGRDDEMSALDRAWSEACQGSPTCVLVVGDAGIGKSRLVGEFADDIRTTGAVVVESRCYESERSLFLQPIVETIRGIVVSVDADVVSTAAAAHRGTLAALVPEVELVVGSAPSVAPLAPEMERRRTFEAVASFLANISRVRPLLIVVDDVHHAGDSTLELIHFMVRADPKAPILVLATAERGHREVASHLGALSIELGPLSEQAVRTAAREAGHREAAHELLRATGGHTLFVLEALDAMSAGGEVVIPASLQDAVTSRVSRCGDDVERFLRAAVVVGGVFDVEHVGELLDLDPEDAIGRAEVAWNAGLLVESASRYAFANEVIRRVLYDTTPAPTRKLRHRRLARLLSEHPEAAARHAAAAGDWATAVDMWIAAAERALGSFANKEAEALLTEALETCALVDEPTRAAHIQLLRGRARLGQARYADASDDLNAVPALARAIGDPDLEATALEDLAWCAYYARRNERAAALADKALAHPRSGVGARVLVGRLRNARGDLAGAIDILEPVADSSDATSRASALSYLGSVLGHSDRFAEAVETLAEAATCCEVAGLLRPMFNAVFFGGIARANAGDLGGASELADRMTADVERYGNDAYRSRAANLRSWLQRELGDPARALDIAHEALEATHLPGGEVEAEPAVHARLQLAESALMLGDDDAAIRWLDEVSGSMLDSVAFGWRVELRRLEIKARLDATYAEPLLNAAARFGSAKYEAMALAHSDRHGEAANAASRTGSDLLLAHVGPADERTRAAERVAARLPPELRAPFMDRGAWRSAVPGL